MVLDMQTLLTTMDNRPSSNKPLCRTPTALEDQCGAQDMDRGWATTPMGIILMANNSILDQMAFSLCVIFVYFQAVGRCKGMLIVL